MLFYNVYAKKKLILKGKKDFYEGVHGLMICVSEKCLSAALRCTTLVE